MFRLYLLLLTLISFYSTACRAPQNIPAGIIDMQYVDLKQGLYKIKIPARVGKSSLGRAALYFEQQTSEKPSTKKFELFIDMKLEGENLIGEFAAQQKDGHTAYIIARWNSSPCPFYSERKVELSKLAAPL